MGMHIVRQTYSKDKAKIHIYIQYIQYKDKEQRELGGKEEGKPGNQTMMQ